MKTPALTFGALLAISACGGNSVEPTVASPAKQKAQTKKQTLENKKAVAVAPKSTNHRGFDWSQPVDKWWTLGDAACPDGAKLEETDEGGTKVYKCMLGKSQHGPEVSWYATGDDKKQYEGLYLYGRQHGVWRYWYPNGNPQMEGNYRNGMPHGAYTDWWMDGNPSTEGVYEDGSRIGVWIDYWQNGQPQRKTRIKEDRMHGLYEEFYEDGSKKKTMEYEKGEIHGKVVQYSQSGTVIGSFEMKEGTGVMREWHDNGVLALQQEYKKSQPVGDYVRWYENGKKAEEGTYRAGAQDGVWRYWRDNGKLYVETEYSAGQSRKATYYDDNGQMTSQELYYTSGYRKSNVNYKDGKKEGEATFWHDGLWRMASRGKYEKGKKAGRWLVWDRYGELHGVELYRKGRKRKTLKLRPIQIAPEYATGEPICDAMIEEVLTCASVPQEKLDELKQMAGYWHQRLEEYRQYTLQDVQVECEVTRESFEEVRKTSGCL